MSTFANSEDPDEMPPAILQLVRHFLPNKSIKKNVNYYL